MVRNLLPKGFDNITLCIDDMVAQYTHTSRHAAQHPNLGHANQHTTLAKAILLNTLASARAMLTNT